MDMDLRTEVARLSQQNKDLKRNNQELRRQNEQLKGQMSRLKEDLGKEKVLVHNLKTRLQAVEQHRQARSPEKPSFSLSPSLLKRKQECDNDPRPLKKANNSLVQTRSKAGAVSDVGKPLAIPAKPPVGGPTNDLLGSTIILRDDVLALPPSDVQVYVRDTPAIHVSPPPLRTTMTRQAIRAAYSISGWSMGHNFEQIPEGMNPCGTGPRTLWFLNPAKHTASPSSPGESGILFRFHHNGTDPMLGGQLSVFRKWTSKSYIYLGEYENSYAEEPVSKEQFCAQKEKVQKHWAQTQMQLLAKMEFSPIRARIALRKQGVNDEVQLAAMVADGPPLKLPEVDESDVLESFRRGHERVHVVRMKFVRYDHAFVNEVVKACAKAKKDAKTQKLATGNTVQTPLVNLAPPAAARPTASLSVPNHKATSVFPLPPKPPPYVGPAVRSPQPTAVASGRASNSINPTLRTVPKPPSRTKVSTSTNSVPLGRTTIPPTCVKAGPLTSLASTSANRASVIARRSMDGVSRSSVQAQSGAVPPGPRLSSSASRDSAPGDDARTSSSLPTNTTGFSSVVELRPQRLHNVAQLAPPPSPSPSSAAVVSSLSAYPPVPSTTPPPLPPLEHPSFTYPVMPLDAQQEISLAAPPPSTTEAANLSVSSSLRALWTNPSSDESMRVWEDEEKSVESDGFSDVSELEYP